MFGLITFAEAKPRRLNIASSHNQVIDLTMQDHGEDDAVHNLTHPPIVIFGEQWQWECRVCTSIPQESKGTLKVLGKGRSKRIITDWQISNQYNWSDGSPVTGYDVKRTVQILRNHLPHINKVIKAIDIDNKNSRKFKITLRGTSSDIYRLMTLRLIPRLKSSNLSYGPYQIKNWRGGFPLLIKNPHFRSDGWPFEEIVFRNRSKTLELLSHSPKSEAVFLPSALPSTPDINSLFHTQKKNIDVFKGVSPILDAIIVNLRNPNLGDALQRQDISDSIDREKVNSVIYKNMGFPTRLFTHPSDPICPSESTIKTTKSKSEKPEYPLVMELTFPKNRKKLAQVIKKSLTEQGYKITLRDVSKNYYENRVLKQADFKDLALVSWKIAPGNLPREVFFSKEIPTFGNSFRGRNLSGWVNKDIDNTLNASGHLPNHRLFNTCKKIQDLFLADVPIISITFRPFYLISTKGLIRSTPTNHLYGPTLFSSQWGIKQNMKSSH